jgi:hypothetical protein
MDALKLKSNNLRLLDYNEMQQTNGGSPKVAIGWKIAAGCGVIGVGVLAGAVAVYAAYKLIKYISD